MSLNLWARITGADKKKKVPEQQASAMGRAGDYSILFPYGLYCDLPESYWVKEVCKGVALPVVTERPADLERGEVAFFHPFTGTQVTLKNNGDIDVMGAAVTINCESATVASSGNINIDAPQTNIGVGGKKIALDDDPVVNGRIVASGINTSI